MYAGFLQQAAALLKMPALNDLSKEMMEIGDKWREISLFSARIGKNRELGPEHLSVLRDMLLERADMEEAFFRKLQKTINSKN